MKILRVASDLYPAFVGGLALHVHELSEMQGKNGNTVTVYTSVWNKEPLSETRTGYEVVRFRGFSILRNSITPGLLLKLFRNAKEYDVVHAHSQLYFSTLLCAIVKRLLKFPFVITNHGIISSTVPFWIHKLYMPTIGRFVLRSADCIISYTPEDSRMLLEYGAKPSTLAIIHNGIKVERFLNQNKTIKKKQILWIGKHVPGKGGEFMIDGFAEFSKSHPEYNLLMVGSGPLKKDILSQIEVLHLSEKIELVNFIPNEKLAAVYLESEIFVLSSLSEGVPKVLLEAMVSGIPVVSTAIPHLLPIIDGCGISIPFSDAKSISSALCHLVSNPELMKEYGENGRRKITQCYDWEDTVNQTTKLLENIVITKGKI